MTGRAHGTLDFYGGLTRSSDVYYYYLAGGYGDFEGLGVERIARYVRTFGLGAPTGLDLPGRVSGPRPRFRVEARRRRRGLAAR